ncbi:putative phospholipase B-like 2 precursor [Danio rerio]|uniref:Phospholipase B-like n=1 Tax=Danio rerio TaxID=7955 RepID=A2RV19_DANRE|nr:putative phospholipase B-like 2 precursor [Danio rerio]AAI33140.1 Zgc:158619 protein [Danio rerio]|eukprot:NP_001076460.1 putative phospholipase B-like 2 precursor [Danio rerio]
MAHLQLLVSAVCVLLSVCQAQIYSAIYEEETAQLLLIEGARTHSVAEANFTDHINTTGWAYLDLSTSAGYNDSLQAYAAGLVEGAATSQLLYKHWMNTLMGYCGPFSSDVGFCERLKDYISTNLQWMWQQMETHTHSPYWHQVRLSLLQLKGLEDGYNGRIDFPSGSFSINPFGFLLFQMGGDLEDLEAALNKSSQSRSVGSGSCSALIKLLPGHKDLLVSHDTWNNYQSMLRIMKRYSLSYRTSPTEQDVIPGATQVFSSYPGSIFSGDDFYLISSGLVTLETTIGNSNAALWKFVQPRGSVMEWLRNIVANRLAGDGQSWAQTFSRYNSGTYNNQWMVVDYKNFVPGQAVAKQGLFTVLEQIPGMIKTADKTTELFQTGYWASYNIPYFEEVFNASGGQELVQKYGSWFSFSQNPRAQIFRRNQTQVTDIQSMERLMRYNNYLEDPLSRCEECDPHQNAENSISARSDLNPANGSYPFGALQQRPHGGTDMKMTSSSMFRQWELLAASGPSCEQTPVFQWSRSPYSSLMHMGQPDRWDFPTVHVRWAT